MTFQSNDAAKYDAKYRDGGYQGVQNLPYRKSCYYPLFRTVLKKLNKKKVKSVFEVGCGSGAFAHLLLDETNITYRGFDFSAEGVSRAVSRTGKSGQFFVGDARNGRVYPDRCEAIVCTEVLEHIEHDLDVMKLWPIGAYCICSVPNFDSKTHVRFFNSEADIAERYGNIIDIDAIERIKKPVLTDISFCNYVRALRWNRYRPDRVRDILGFGKFADVGGWFIFSGYRNY